MHGHALSGSRKLNRHWQSGRKGFYPLRFWEWAATWVFVSQNIYSKYRARKMSGVPQDYLDLYIRNPLYPTTVTEKEPLYSYPVTTDGVYYFKIHLDMKSKPSFLKDIPLYFIDMRYGVSTLGVEKQDFISSLESVRYSKKSVDINSCHSAYGSEQMTEPKDLDFIPGESTLFVQKGFQIDNPLEIVCSISATKNQQIYFHHKVLIDYKYMNPINGSSLPTETNVYYGYGTAQGEWVQDIVKNNLDSSGHFMISKLSSDDRKKLLEITNMRLDAKVTMITESEYQKYAKEYGTTQ